MTPCNKEVQFIAVVAFHELLLKTRTHLCKTFNGRVQGTSRLRAEVQKPD